MTIVRYIREVHNDKLFKPTGLEVFGLLNMGGGAIDNEEESKESNESQLSINAVTDVIGFIVEDGYITGFLDKNSIVKLREKLPYADVPIVHIVNPNEHIYTDTYDERTLKASIEYFKGMNFRYNVIYDMKNGNITLVDRNTDIPRLLDDYEKQIIQFSKNNKLCKTDLIECIKRYNIDVKRRMFSDDRVSSKLYDIFIKILRNEIELKDRIKNVEKNDPDLEKEVSKELNEVRKNFDTENIEDMYTKICIQNILEQKDIIIGNLNEYINRWILWFRETNVDIENEREKLRKNYNYVYDTLKRIASSSNMTLLGKNHIHDIYRNFNKVVMKQMLILNSGIPDSNTEDVSKTFDSNTDEDKKEDVSDIPESDIPDSNTEDVSDIPELDIPDSNTDDVSDIPDSNTGDVSKTFDSNTDEDKKEDVSDIPESDTDEDKKEDVSDIPELDIPDSNTEDVSDIPDSNTEDVSDIPDSNTDEDKEKDVSDIPDSNTNEDKKEDVSKTSESSTEKVIHTNTVYIGDTISFLNMINVKKDTNVKLRFLIEQYVSEFVPTLNKIRGNIINLIGEVPFLRKFTKDEREPFMRYLNSNAVINIDRILPGDYEVLIDIITNYRKGKGRVKTLGNRSTLFMMLELDIKDHKEYITLIDLASRENPKTLLSSFFSKNISLKTLLGPNAITEIKHHVNPEVQETPNYIYELLRESFYINETYNHIKYFLNKRQSRERKVVFQTDKYSQDRFYVDPEGEYSTISIINNCLIIPLLQFIEHKMNANVTYDDNQIL